MRNGLIVDDDGTKEWYIKGQLHRLNGPAIECESGTKEWYIKGQLHRTDGPAVEHVSGTRLWYQNGELHRTDGPAIEYTDVHKLWYLRDVEYTFIEWLEETNATEVEKTIMRLQYA